MCIYVRPLSDAERTEVERLARSGDAVTYRHARVVLLSAQGRRVSCLVREVGLSDRRIRELIHRFNEHGPPSLARKKPPGAQPLCDATARGALLELLRRSPTEFGIERATWTGADLAAVAVSQGIVAALSERTARREIVRAGERWQQAKRWSKKEPEYERKKTAPAARRAGDVQPRVGSGV
jgi:transposase